MRWRRLFADIEAQLEEAERLELEDEITERIRSERQNINLVDRLRVAEGRPVEVRVVGAGVVRGSIRQVGADWFLLGGDAGAEYLVPMAATLAVTSTGVKAAVALGAEGLLWKMTLRYALSVISRDRSVVLVTLADGASVSGTIDAVGADFVDVTPREPGEARASRPAAAFSLPFSGIGVVRSGSS